MSKWLYPCSAGTYTLLVASFRQSRAIASSFRHFLATTAVAGILTSAALGRQNSAAGKSAQGSPQAEKKQPELSAQIELLETRVRFKANGESRKEVHAIVHINDELGAQQFARISFDYNRSFQQIEFPLLRITHTGGGTADILPSAVADQPNSAVVNAPAYQEVRVKSVRLLGLAPGDTVEYRVVTTTTKHPLAPDFWLDHTFDRSGVVSHEIFEVDLPKTSDVSVWINPGTPAEPIIDDTQEEPRRRYRWDRQGATGVGRSGDETNGSDVALTTFPSWNAFSDRMLSLMRADYKSDATVFAKAAALQQTGRDDRDPHRALYDFVSQKIKTIELPLGATGYRTRPPSEIIKSGYGTAEDKCMLLLALTNTTRQNAVLGLVQSRSIKDTSGLARPTAFDHILVVAPVGHTAGSWMDPSVAVAPYGVISSALRGRPAFILGSSDWTKTSADLPFASSQRVTIEANISSDGRLDAKVRYWMRGENELALRVAFHESPREKWPEVAQLLALADGFRGKIIHVTASDPYATNTPFAVEYEISQPKFIDWSKKPVRIPALLPQIGLPDVPGATPSGSKASPIELGTPLTIETHLTLRLPAGTTAQAPVSSSVVRDYAKFNSKYEASGQTITAERRISFLERSIPSDRAADYNAFVRAVQTDEAQNFALQRADSQAASANKPSEAPPKQPK